MIALSLAEIAEITHGRLNSASLPEGELVAGVVETDSREIVAGGIFVAKPGEFTDGHLFVPAAIENGASLIIVERELDAAVPQIVVDDVITALGLLATEVVARVRAAGRLKIVAVTGSNGKTTTKNLLRSILELRGNTIAPIASFNNEVGAPLTMLKVSEATDFLVAEMGASKIGEIKRLVGMARPDVGIVLTVGLAHAGEFGGIAKTLTAKTEMVADLLPTDTAVLNADDRRVLGMAKSTAASVLKFGRGEDDRADPNAVQADDITSGADGTHFTLRLPNGQSHEVHFAVLGEHHITNALAAAAGAFALGTDIDTIVKGLESVVRAERWRMEIVANRDVTVINDAYNASPDSMAAALKTLAQVAPVGGRTVAVLGEMSELGEFSNDEHDTIGLLVVRLNISQLVVVGQGARRIHMAANFQGSWDGESILVDTQDEAYELLRELIEPGDTVLVKSSNSANLRFLGDRLGESFA